MDDTAKQAQTPRWGGPIALRQFFASLDYPERIDPAAVEWLYANAPDSVRHVFDMLITTATKEGNFVSSEELEQYNRLVKSGRALSGEALQAALREEQNRPQGRPVSEIRAEIDHMHARLKPLKARHAALMRTRERFVEMCQSLHDQLGKEQAAADAAAAQSEPSSRGAEVELINTNTNAALEQLAAALRSMAALHTPPSKAPGAPSPSTSFSPKRAPQSPSASLSPMGAPASPSASSPKRSPPASPPPAETPFFCYHDAAPYFEREREVTAAAVRRIRRITRQLLESCETGPEEEEEAPSAEAGPSAKDAEGWETATQELEKAVRRIARVQEEQGGELLEELERLRIATPTIELQRVRQEARLKGQEAVLEAFKRLIDGTETAEAAPALAPEGGTPYAELEKQKLDKVRRTLDELADVRALALREEYERGVNAQRAWLREELETVRKSLNLQQARLLIAAWRLDHEWKIILEHATEVGVALDRLQADQSGLAARMAAYEGLRRDRREDRAREAPPGHPDLEQAAAMLSEYLEGPPGPATGPAVAAAFARLVARAEEAEKAAQAAREAAEERSAVLREGIRELGAVLCPEGLGGPFELSPKELGEAAEELAALRAELHAAVSAYVEDYRKRVRAEEERAAGPLAYERRLFVDFFVAPDRLRAAVAEVEARAAARALRSQLAPGPPEPPAGPAPPSSGGAFARLMRGLG